MAIVLERTDVAAFGAFLRHAREKRGLTLEQISSETRIPRRHLDALEHGDLDAVPGGMYRRAEVRAYADVVGLDKGLALAQLEQVLERLEASKPQVRPIPLEPSERNWSGYGAMALVAVIALWGLSRWQWQPVPQVIDPVSAASPREAGTAAVAPAASIELPADESSVPLGTVAEPVASTAPANAPAATAAATPAVTPIAGAPPGRTPAAPIEPALVVTSSPQGARVLVDGIGRGQTPLTIRHLGAGDRRIRVVLDGYVGHEQRVSLDGQRARSVHVELQPAQ